MQSLEICVRILNGGKKSPLTWFIILKWKKNIMQKKNIKKWSSKLLYRNVILLHHHGKKDWGDGFEPLPVAFLT